MCGIAGSLGSASAGPLSISARVERMAATLVHRGPDAGGVWTDAAAGVCLGNRRLAIVDRSDAGAQPMRAPSGRYTVTINGEIYNHHDLRRTLESDRRAPTWRGTSDTETFVAALDAWGIVRTLEACVGMFAVAIWDRESRRLTLARDRVGEKPLFYGRFAGTWLFGSEMKALAAHPSFRRVVDPDAFAHYLALGWVGAPSSIYEGVRKLRPGCHVTLAAGDDDAHEEAYWSALDVAARSPLSFANDDEAIDRLEALFAHAVREQMIADRPVGALLSGGIDSSSIVALMRAAGCANVETFSIGFREHAYNEADYASTVARHFKTTHTELYVDAGDVRDTIPLMPEVYDEPLADPSQIPTFLVSRLASRSVTVALTGDGGDELFGGYPRYAMAGRLWPLLSRIPPRWRPAVGHALGRAPTAVDRAFAWAFPHDEGAGIRGLRPGQKLTKLGRAVASRDMGALYWQLLAPWAEPHLARAPGSPFPADRDVFRASGIEENFMHRDLVGYLPDDILAKIDRAAMAVGLESRAPLLDHRIVEFALRLPLEYKLRDGVGKWLLRQMLFRHIPRELVDRPKMGFVIPIAAWLRGPLKPWAYDLVGSARGDIANLLDLGAVRRLLDRHSSGVGDWHQPLWTSLMFLNWAQHADRQATQATDDEVAWRPTLRSA